MALKIFHLIIFILFMFYYHSDGGQTDVSGVAIFRKVYSINWKQKAIDWDVWRAVTEASTAQTRCNT
jgi:hypothetical protein